MYTIQKYLEANTAASGLVFTYLVLRGQLTVGQFLRQRRVNALQPALGSTQHRVILIMGKLNWTLEEDLGSVSSTSTDALGMNGSLGNSVKRGPLGASPN